METLSYLSTISTSLLPCFPPTMMVMNSLPETVSKPPNRQHIPAKIFCNHKGMSLASYTKPRAFSLRSQSIFLTHLCVLESLHRTETGRFLRELFLFSHISHACRLSIFICNPINVIVTFETQLQVLSPHLLLPRTGGEERGSCKPHSGRPGLLCTLTGLGPTPSGPVCSEFLFSAELPKLPGFPQHCPRACVLAHASMHAVPTHMLICTHRHVHTYSPSKRLQMLFPTSYKGSIIWRVLVHCLSKATALPHLCMHLSSFLSVGSETKCRAS